MAIADKFKEMLGDPEGPSGLYDIILATDETDAGRSWTGLMLAGVENPFVEKRAPVLGQRVSSGRFILEDRDPLTHLVWRQEDWSDGALFETTKQTNKGYLKGNMDAAFPNVIGPGIAKNFGSDRGNTRQPIGWLLRNPHFESDADDGWDDDSGASGTVDMQATDDFRSTILGSQSCKVTWTGTSAGVAAISQTLANPTVWQSKSITVSCYFKKSTGSGGVELHVSDGVGTTTGTGVTSASDWTLVTVTHSVSASASQVDIQLRSTNTSTWTGWVDDFTVYSGSTTANTHRVVALDDGDIYTHAGRIIAKLATGTTDQFRWDAVYIDGSNDVIDMMPYRNSAGTPANHVYASFGTGAGFVYGSGTSWTTSTLTGSLKDAHYWAVSRNSLWKSETENEIKYATNPLNGGSWSTAYTVGATIHPIVDLYSFRDTVLVGKEDGVWRYRRVYEDGTDANTFENLTNEFRYAPSQFHFRSGVEFPADGALYLPVGGSGGLLRIGIDDTITDMTRLILRPESFVVNGLVYAMAADAHTIWCFVDDQLLAISYNARGELVANMRADAPSVSPSALAASETSSFDTGWVSAGTGAEDTSPGGEDWANESNITASDDSRATTPNTTGSWGSPQVTNYLKATNFGFSIPTNATITGIETRVEGSWSAAGGGVTASENNRQLLRAGTATGSNKSGTVWDDNTDSYKSKGGSTDTWGATWSATDINDTNFGFRIQLINNGVTVGPPTFRVDNMQIKVYYSLTSSSADVLLPKAASVVNWDVASIKTPHLLGVYAGKESTDNEPYVVTDCWALPDEGLSPMNDSSDLPASPTTQKFYTSRWDADAPTELKVASHLEVLMRENDSTQPFAVKFGTDGADHTSTSLGTLNGAEAVQTLYFGDVTDFETATVFSDIGLYFEGTITGSKQKAQIRAFELHAYPVIEIVKTFEIKAQVGNAMLHNGASQELVTNGTTLMSELDTFESREATFYLIEDLDRDGIPTAHPVVVRPGSIVKTPSRGGTLWEMVLQGTLATS